MSNLININGFIFRSSIEGVTSWPARRMVVLIKSLTTATRWLNAI